MLWALAIHHLGSLTAAAFGWAAQKSRERVRQAGEPDKPIS
jgi:hypothetical protein